MTYTAIDNKEKYYFTRVHYDESNNLIGFNTNTGKWAWLYDDGFQLIAPYQRKIKCFRRF